MESLVRNTRRKIEIEKPAIQTFEDERLWQDIRKFSHLIPSEPEPNLGRVREIQEEIKKDNYITPEVIQETAARLVIRFMKKD